MMELIKTPIETEGSAYSAGRYLYQAIALDPGHVIAADRETDALLSEGISGIFVFGPGADPAAVADMGVKNWAFGRSHHGHYQKDGKVFGEDSLFLAVAGATSDALLTIAGRLCERSAQKAVLLKDCAAGKLFLVELNGTDTSSDAAKA